MGLAVISRHMEFFSPLRAFTQTSETITLPSRQKTVWVPILYIIYNTCISVPIKSHFCISADTIFIDNTHHDKPLDIFLEDAYMGSLTPGSHVPLLLPVHVGLINYICVIFSVSPSCCSSTIYLSGINCTNKRLLQKPRNMRSRFL